MQINNPLQMNDWEIKKFLTIILVFQLATWGAISLDAIRLQIPILRQFIGFIYLTFVPGILILRILNLHKLGNVKTILYTVGLSISTLMFAGFFINISLPHWGISNPISLRPLIFAISIIVVFFSILAYIRDRSFSSPEYISVHEFISPPILILFLLPFFAIGGTYLVNIYNNNILLMSLLLIIAFVPNIMVVTRFIPKKYYPYTVFILAITLLYHWSLTSMYLWGWDIQLEYYTTNYVIQNSLWDPIIYDNLNAMLSLVILGPIYSIILNMGTDWIFKIVYPFLFAFVPLGLYELVRNQTNEKIAFFSCFFFISFFAFYMEMLSLARQELAEIFLVLIILSMIDQNLNEFSKSAFFFVFSSSLIVSHYGLSYLFMLILVFAWGIAFVLHSVSYRKYFIRFSIWSQGKTESYRENNKQNDSFSLNPIPFIFVLWYIIFLLAWYIFTTGSSSFDSIVSISSQITTSMSSEFLNTNEVQGIALITVATGTPLHELFKYMNLLTIFFIVIGFISSVVKYIKAQFDIRYLLLSFGALCICMAGLVLPYFTSALNTSRIYQISLIFLAPFCVIGGLTVIRVKIGFFKKSWTNQWIKKSFQILSVFFAIFLLFNSGWIYEIAKDHPVSIALSQNTLKNSVNIENKILLYNLHNVLEEDVFSARWFDRSVDQGLNTKVYVDSLAHHPLISYGMTPLIYQKMLSDKTTNIEPETYIFLGYTNIVENIARKSPNQPIFNISELHPLLSKTNKIYSNGGSEMYYNNQENKS